VNLWALVVAAIGAVVLVRMVRTGSAGVDGESLKREDMPEVYWTIFVAAVLTVIFLLGVGLGLW
jgi:heme/copper-type cytochrome/quinol oxidase subunit 2